CGNRGAVCGLVRPDADRSAEVAAGAHARAGISRLSKHGCNPAGRFALFPIRQRMVDCRMAPHLPDPPAGYQSKNIAADPHDVLAGAVAGTAGGGGPVAPYAAW